MRSHRLLPDDYQELLDLGWRRSGTYCYNPINKLTCCPNYSIICQASQFKLSRSQRRCVTNVNSYLVNDNIDNKVNLCYGHQEYEDMIEKSVNAQDFAALKKSPKARDRRFVASCERKMKLYNISLEEAMKNVKRRSLHRLNRLATLEDYLYPKTTILSNPRSAINPKHRLEIKLSYVESSECKSFRNNESELIKRYQKAVHNEPESEWTMSRFCGFLVETPLVVEPIKNLDFDVVEDDTLTKSFESNDQWLIVKPPRLPASYGTYHCLYLLDDKLIAVGVLDILPKCITTVYFFYEPDYGFLNLGIYSALVEISLVRQLTNHIIKGTVPLYYHLGFYVHECKKMHYKTNFRPSYLLCSETRQYVDTDICLKRLLKTKYARFSDDDSTQDSVQDFHELIYQIPVITPVTNTPRMIDYLLWLEQNLDRGHAEKLLNCLTLYVRLVGPQLATRMTLGINLIHRILVRIHARENDNSSNVR